MAAPRIVLGVCDTVVRRPLLWVGLVCLGAGLATLVPRAADGWQAAEAPADQKQAPDAPRPPDQRAERFIGRVISIPSPITDRVESQIRRLAARAIDDAKQQGGRVWPVLIFEFQPGDNELGKAYDLANFLSGPALAGATTVAYVPKPLTGHAVLPVLACDQIAMHPEAELGPAGSEGEAIGPGELNLYKTIAARRKTVPVAVALGLLDSRLEVLEVETEVNREYILADELDELKKTRAIQSQKVLFRAGEPHRLAGDQASKLGFIARLADTKEELAKAYGLPREALQDDPSQGGQWRAARIVVDRPIDPSLVGQVQRAIDDAIKLRDANLICVVINSPGGSPVDSMTLANFLADLDPAQRRTVAYVDNKALADAAAIALACDDLVMKPEARLGGEGAYALTDRGEIDALLTSVGEMARRKFRSPALAGALVAPQATVYRYTHKGLGFTEFFTEQEAAALPEPDAWERGPAVNEAGKALQLDGAKAAELGLASHTVDNFAGLKRIYGLENDPELVEPGWAHFLIDALRNPAVAWFLLVIGGAALWAELHTPGMGLGAFVALVCFLLFFWSMFLGGTAGWLEAMLFLVGVVCILIEMFVLPGFGIFGLGGGFLVLASLVLASQTFVWPQNDYQVGQMSQSLSLLVGAMVAVVALAFMMRRFLPKAPVLNQLLLAPPAGAERESIAEREALAHYDHLVGARGVVITQLRPGGKARFDGNLVDVLADGEIIPPGVTVEVVAVQGNRVVVRPVG